MMVINVGVLIFFITKAVQDKNKRTLVAWMALGFTLTNGNYVYRFVNHQQQNKKFCHHCVNKEDGCCQLECHHKQKACGTSCGSKNHHKPVNHLSLLMNLLSFIGILINIICFITYYRNHRCRSKKISCKDECC
jgi:hypothetical protein